MITSINPALLIDGYKADHRRQYPEGTEFVYSNFTPRQSRIDGVNEVVFFGLQYFIKEYLIERWNTGFFNKPKETILSDYKRRMDNYLGKDSVPCEHIAELHDLGYLPVKIKAVKEGSLIPIGVPVLTIVNTIPKFFWLTNYFETLMSNILWKPITSATTAFQYRKKFNEFAEKTGYDKGFIQWQGHDFSFRGMSGNEDSLMSGAGHLLSFTGTDTIPAIDFLEKYYNANSDNELIGGSVPATEHSVMCMGEEESEINTFKRLITELYPNGIVSIVSDTWDFWKVMTEYLPQLKNEILARNGRLVIRPDSGDPVKIICGDLETSYSVTTEYQKKGAYEILWDVFGGTINDKGYKVLNPKVGMIYGDSITLERQKQILEKLQEKGFSASNLVLGIGSFTYEYVTRDTFGFAMKATWGQVNGQPKDIFKNPKTDSGFKKSAKGLLKIEYSQNGKIALYDQVSKEEEETGLLELVFENG
ncbi:MAG: nicotinate phosphoribosyltransferase, partial [bacterium]|nr:nicotinate phosphoribosyltransferase [bacterium]